LTIRIGTRASQLALWQATFVEQQLRRQSLDTRIVPITSDGDADLVSPLYELGIQGIFTKTLDAALLAGQIDLAVHSYKDVPTQLAQGLAIAAIPQRGNWLDVLVFKDPERKPAPGEAYTVATSSLRRKAQWLHRYPQHHIEPLRGNIQTRLQKLLDRDDWDAAIFAAAGVERANLPAPHLAGLDWMLPAPAQGALAVVCRADDEFVLEACRPLNHRETALCTQAEKDFLRTLQGGCSTPIAALALVEGDQIDFRGNIISADAMHKLEVHLRFSLEEAEIAGQKAAGILLEQGARTILDSWSKKMN
jgi:hydroxymethylbilane synthase